MLAQGPDPGDPDTGADDSVVELGECERDDLDAPAIGDRKRVRYIKESAPE